MFGNEVIVDGDDNYDDDDDAEVNDNGTECCACFRKLLSIYIFNYVPFVFEGRIWDLIVSVPNHLLSFYLTAIPQ